VPELILSLLSMFLVAHLDILWICNKKTEVLGSSSLTYYAY